MPRVRAAAEAGGLPGLRRGTITELLFLYECVTHEVTQLKDVGVSLGLTVQAASATFLRLKRQERIEVVGGRYHPTVPGVAWLHATLGALGDDVERRRRALHVIRHTRAVAREDLPAGSRVVLSLEDGVLGAAIGVRGASRGEVRAEVKKGEIAEVEELEGIVPIAPAAVDVLVVRSSEVNRPEIQGALARAVDSSPGLLGAYGPEAFHLLRRVASRAVARFGVAAAASEAAQLGVPSTVVVLDDELPRFIAALTSGNPPELRVRSLPRGRGRRRSSDGGRT